MKVEKNKHTVIVKDTQGDLSVFIDKITNQFKAYDKLNIIVDLSQYNEIVLKDIKLFLPLSKKQLRNKKSFVLVVSETDFNIIPDEIIVVPSLLEAHDIIEMEEIERDLGF